MGGVDVTVVELRQAVARVDVRALRDRALTGLLVALAALVYVVGWSAGAVVQAGIWAWSGLVVGWRDGRDSIRKGWSA